MANEVSPLEEPAFMRAVLDLVIPPRADGVLPGAGALGLGGEVAEQLRADTSDGPGVAAGLAAVQASARARDAEGFTALSAVAQLAVLQSQLPEHPALIPGLIRYVYVAYYQHPTVLGGLEQPARAPFPEGFDVEETDPALLALLESRRIRAPED